MVEARVRTDQNRDLINETRERMVDAFRRAEETFRCFGAIRKEAGQRLPCGRISPLINMDYAGTLIIASGIISRMKRMVTGAIAALIILILYGVLRPSLSRDTRPQTDKIWKLGYQHAITSVGLRLDDYVRDHNGQAPDSIEQLLSEPTDWLSFPDDEERYANQIIMIIKRMVIKPDYKFPKGLKPTNTIAVLIPKGTVDSGEYVYCSSASGGYDTVDGFESDTDKTFIEELRYRNAHPGSFKVINKTDERKDIKLYIVSDIPSSPDRSTTKP